MRHLFLEGEPSNGLDAADKTGVRTMPGSGIVRIRRDGGAVGPTDGGSEGGRDGGSEPSKENGIGEFRQESAYEEVDSALG